MTDKRRVRGLAIHRPIVYGNVAMVIPEAERDPQKPLHVMRWTLAVRSATSPPPGSSILSNRSIPVDILGGQDDLSRFIRKVQFKLHDSYPNHIRTVDRPPFEISETGWGEFTVNIKIFFVSEAAEKPLQLNHPLKLHPFTDPVPSPRTPWLDQSAVDETSQNAPEPGHSTQKSTSSNQPEPPEPDIVPQNSQPIPQDSETASSQPQTNPLKPEVVASNSETIPQDPKTIPPESQPAFPAPELLSTVMNSWQYDEIVFTEPTEAFYHKLLESPPSSLPDRNRFDSRYVPQIGPKGGSGEFTLEMEHNEFKKLDWANVKVLMEIDRLRSKLSRDERELVRLRKEHS